MSRLNQKDLKQDNLNSLLFMARRKFEGSKKKIKICSAKRYC